MFGRSTHLATLTAATFAAGAIALAALPAAAKPAVNQPAPAFTAVDSNGETVSLDTFKGKTVVLEWTNHDCPYVKKHYGTGNMQALQTAAASDDVVWLSVISSAPGTQGHVDGAKANRLTASRNAAPTRVLLDPEGVVGKSFDARTTPQMFVIDPEGTLRYMGAIDDKPSTRKSDVAGATNYLTGALTALAAGQSPDPAVTRPYGCSVKYGS